MASAYTDTDLANVRAAMLRPEGEVEVRNRRVRYRTLSELQDIEKAIIRDLSAASATTRPRQTLMVADKGF